MMGCFSCVNITSECASTAHLMIKLMCWCGFHHVFVLSLCIRCIFFYFLCHSVGTCKTDSQDKILCKFKVDQSSSFWCLWQLLQWGIIWADVIIHVCVFSNIHATLIFYFVHNSDEIWKNLIIYQILILVCFYLLRKGSLDHFTPLYSHAYIMFLACVDFLIVFLMVSLPFCRSVCQMTGAVVIITHFHGLFLHSVALLCVLTVSW